MFFITSVRYDKEAGKSDTACFGYVEQCEDAHGIVARNTCDLEEYYYNYLVIEEIPQGIHPTPISECWFKWNKKQNIWEQINAPKFSRSIINWCGVG